MIRWMLAALLCLAGSALVAAAPAPTKAPKPLLAQVQRMGELLRDSSAVLVADSTMVQFVRPRDGDELALVVFTVEGFGGGNSHTQYFAVFNAEKDAKGKSHFSLIDFLPIAGKGWRGIDNLNAKVTRNQKAGETFMAIDALEVAGNDAPNFPSQKVTINLVLRDGRLFEQKLR